LRPHDFLAEQTYLFPSAIRSLLRSVNNVVLDGRSPKLRNFATNVASSRANSPATPAPRAAEPEEIEKQNDDSHSADLELIDAMTFSKADTSFIIFMINSHLKNDMNGLKFSRKEKMYAILCGCKSNAQIYCNSLER